MDWQASAMAVAEKIRRNERERCARIAEAHAEKYKSAVYTSVCQQVAEEIAAAIRGDQ